MGDWAAIAVAVFVGAQVLREWWRVGEQKTAAQHRALGRAWMARRTLEKAIHRGRSVSDNLPRAKRPTEGMVEWAEEVTKSLDTVEAQVQEALFHAAEAGGNTSKEGRKAFDSFIGYADRVNEIARRSGWSDTPGLRGEVGSHLKEALVHAGECVAALEVLAPRTDHEGETPPMDQILASATKAGKLLTEGDDDA